MARPRKVTVQVNIRIPQDQYKKLTMAAIQDSVTSGELVSVADIIRTLVQTYLREIGK